MSVPQMRPQRGWADKPKPPSILLHSTDRDTAITGSCRGHAVSLNTARPCSRRLGWYHTTVIRVQLQKMVQAAHELNGRRKGSAEDIAPLERRASDQLPVGRPRAVSALMHVHACFGGCHVVAESSIPDLLTCASNAATHTVDAPDSCGNKLRQVRSVRDAQGITAAEPQTHSTPAVGRTSMVRWTA